MTTSVAPESTAAPVRVKGCCLPLAPALGSDAAERLAATFRALADPTRVQMLHMLKAASGPACVCDFTEAFGLSQPTISHHIGKLREAGFVHSFKKGVWSFYSLDDDMPAQARAALALIP